ncbi:hypothetical protein GF407_11215 [candidate division KSB1 bacterium]|nr:hypothetical protein [candidate division KSB1 bacterium]
MKIIKKIVFTITISILILFILLIITMQTPWFKDKLAKELSSLISGSIPGEIQIDKIRGNLLRDIEISGLTIAAQKDTLLYVPLVAITYSPLHLLNNEINIKYVGIKSPDISILQGKNGRWNFNTVFSSGENGSESSGFGWKLDFDTMVIQNSTIDIAMAERKHQIENLDMQAQFSYAEGKINFFLKDFSFIHADPAINIKSLKSRGSYSDQTLTVDTLSLRSDISDLYISGKFILPNLNRSRFLLQANPLHTRDFLPLFTDSELNKTFDIRLAKATENSNRYTLTLIHENQRLQVNGEIDSFQELDMTGSLSNIDLSGWLESERLDSEIDANLVFKRQKTGTTLSLTFQPSKVANFPIEKGELTLTKKDSLLSASLLLKNNLSAVQADGKVAGPDGTGPFRLNASINNIAAPDPSTIPVQNLNLTLATSGKTRKFQPVSAKGELSAFDLRIDTFIIDSVHASVDYDSTRLNIGELNIQSPYGQLEGTARYHSDSLWFSYTLTPDQVENLSSQLLGDTLAATGKIDGELNLDTKNAELRHQADLNLQQIKFGNIACDSLSGSSLTRRKDSVWSSSADIRLEQLRYANVLTRGVSVDAKWQADSVVATVDLQSEKINSSISFRSHLRDSLSIIIPRFDLEIGDTEWHIEELPASLLIVDQTIHLDHFELYSKNSSLAAFLHVTDSLYDISLSGERLPLFYLNHFLDLPVTFDGYLNTTFSGTGVLNRPDIQGQLSLDSLVLNSVLLGNYNARLDYRNDAVDVQSELIKTDTLSVRTKLLFDAKKRQFISDTSAYMEVSTQTYDLTTIDKLVDKISIENGTLSTRIRLRNPLFSLDPGGRLAIKDGKMRVPDTEVYYPNINLDSRISNHTIELETVRVESENGWFTSEGTIALPSTWQNFMNRSTVDFVFKANNFIPIHNQDIELVLDGQGSLSGSLSRPQIQTETTIQRAQIFVPAFLQGQSGPQYQPILVRDSLALRQGRKAGYSEPEIFEKIDGKVTISIPRNTWLKGDDFNVEISGELILEFRENDLKIFGTLNTLRGTYDFFGRRFKLNKGNLMFQGDEVILDVEAVYRFRDSKKRRQRLVLYLGGNTSNPDIRFELNNIAIQEREAVSYLLFGRSYEQLTHGEKSQLGEKNQLLSGQSVGKLLAGQLVSRLTSSLGESLNLDVIEFRSSGNLGQSSITIGKYLTHDLFVSYERGLSMDQSNEINPEIIILEYEIMPWLFLQATHGSEKETGFDMIFKWTDE